MIWTTQTLLVGVNTYNFTTARWHTKKNARFRIERCVGRSRDRGFRCGLRCALDTKIQLNSVVDRRLELHRFAVGSIRIMIRVPWLSFYLQNRSLRSLKKQSTRGIGNKTPLISEKILLMGGGGGYYFQKSGKNLAKNGGVLFPRWIFSRY